MTLTNIYHHCYIGLHLKKLAFSGDSTFIGKCGPEFLKQTLLNGMLHVGLIFLLSEKVEADYDVSLTKQYLFT